MKKCLAIVLALALCLTACATCFASSDESYILEEGADNALVTILQYLLLTAGYYNDEVDGEFGPVTKAAVEAMQKDLGEEITGTVDVSGLIGEFDPAAWIDWAAAGGYDIDDEVKQVLEELLTADLYDDELPYDFIADLSFIYELAEEEVLDKNAVAIVLAALIAIAYDAEEEDNADTDALLRIAALIFDEDDEYAEQFGEYLDNIYTFVEASEDPKYIEDYQNILIDEILDNSDLRDVSVLLHIPAFLADPSNSFEDMAQAYIILAIIDYFDDDFNSDVLELYDLVKNFDYENEDGYEYFAENVEALLSFLSEGSGKEYRDLYIDLLKTDFLDDKKIEDFEEDLFFILLLANEEYDLADDLLLSAGVLDFVDDYDYTDVGIAYEIAKLYAETQDSPELLDTIHGMLAKVV